MADEPKTAGQASAPKQNGPQSGGPQPGSQPQQQKGEVSATDLLSLWGKPPTPALAPAPIRPTAPPPSAPPAAPPSAPSVSRPAPAAGPPPAPKIPAVASPPTPAPAPTPAPKPKVYEGEVVETPKVPKTEASPKQPAPQPERSPAPLRQAQGDIRQAQGGTAHVPEPEAPPEFLSEKEGFAGQLDEFLSELNLSRRHIGYAFGCIVLIAALVWGGVWGYRLYTNRAQNEPPAPKPEAEISEQQTGIPAVSQAGQISKTAAVGETGLSATIAIGQTEAVKTDIAYYILIFRRLQNAYETNIDALLNQSSERRAKLRSHLALLKKLHGDGGQLLEQMKSAMQKIEEEYEPQRQAQETTDANFFEQLNAYNAQTTQDILDDFIEASKNVVSLRAQFKAIQQIAGFYEEGLPKVAVRIRDIELNEEPLVAGIKVYDVPGSDVKLIVPVSGAAGEPPQSLSSSPAFPLLPVSPADVKSTERDFITQPGGGF